MRSIPGGIDGLEAVFDDSCLVAGGGLLLVGTVMHRLGLEALIDETVRLDGRVAGSGSGRKVLSLVASMLVGGCCIDDVQRLQSGSAAAVLAFGVVAPSTAGSFLRSFTANSTGGCDRSAMMAGCAGQHPTGGGIPVWHNVSASMSAPASRPCQQQA